VVLFATSSRTTIMASSFSDADLATATALFAGLVFAVPRDGAEGRGEVVADTCYAALLTGVALGEKVNAVPAALIILAMTVVRARRCLDGAPRATFHGCDGRDLRRLLDRDGRLLVRAQPRECRQPSVSRRLHLLAGHEVSRDDTA